MRITIEYVASWRNSFLDPTTSNNEPLPKNGRKFIGSMTSLKNEENYIKREITLDTVMGVLNRLIGDQRKLYQARSSSDYYFQGIEQSVRFEDNPESVSNEVTYIRNITGSTDQNSYTGMIKVNDPIFISNYSKKLWSVLALNLEELCDFIIKEKWNQHPIELNPLTVIGQLEMLNKLKPLPKKGDIAEAHKILSSRFEKFKGVNRNGEVLPISLYCSSLYLQMERLENEYDFSLAKTKSGGLSGISNNGFTKKDFMNRYTTGDKKRIWGNPYTREEYVKGEGKVMYLLTKASGSLEVNIDIERDQAKKLLQDIENAGVSSFYLGKKGLAYISDIRV